MASILILTPQFPYPPHAFTGYTQGTTLRNFNLIAWLAERHTVDLLTFMTSPGPARPGDGETGSAAADGACASLQPYCRRVLAYPAPVRSLARRGYDTLLNPLPDMALRLASPAMHAHLTRLLRENHYDVLQVEGIEMAPYALEVARKGCPSTGARPRLVFDDHNAEYLLQKRAFLADLHRPGRWPAAFYSLIQWRKLAAYERRICQAADHVIAVSDADRHALQRLVPGLEVTVVPNGVDLAFYRPDAVSPQPGMGPHALVFTGKMDYRPNVDAVLWFAEAVLPLILARVPDVRFYVVGQQPHARLARLAGHPAIILTGRVPDVRPYIAGAAVYVVPLRIGGGTRLKVLEAMAMARAIVSTHLGCDGFPFEDRHQVRLADEPAAFAAAVIELLHDHQQAEALGRTARAFVEAHFGWGAILPRLEKLYP